MSDRCNSSINQFVEYRMARAFPRIAVTERSFADCGQPALPLHECIAAGPLNVQPGRSYAILGSVSLKTDNHARRGISLLNLKTFHTGECALTTHPVGVVVTNFNFVNLQYFCPSCPNFPCSTKVAESSRALHTQREWIRFSKCHKRYRTNVSQREICQSSRGRVPQIGTVGVDTFDTHVRPGNPYILRSRERVGGRNRCRGEVLPPPECH